MFSLNIVFDSRQELIGKIAVFEEIRTVFQVDNGGFRGDSGGFGFLSELDEGMVGFCEVEIDDVRGGGALNTGDFEGTSHEASEAESGITGGVFLVIGAFVGFVDDDEAEVLDGGEEGGAGADDNKGRSGFENA